MGSALGLLVCYQHWSVCKHGSTDDLSPSFFTVLFVAIVLFVSPFLNVSLCILRLLHKSLICKCIVGQIICWIEALIQNALKHWCNVLSPRSLSVISDRLRGSNQKCCAVTNTLLSQAAINSFFRHNSILYYAFSSPKSPLTKSRSPRPLKGALCTFS